MSNSESFERVIRDSGEGWLIDMFAPSHEAIPHLVNTVERASAYGRKRLQGNAPNISVDAIVTEHENNPLRARAVIQVLGATATPAMLVMAWRIMQGMEVHEVDMSHRRLETFNLRVVLRAQYEDGELEVYESNEINDFKMLRHIGISSVNGKPMLDGFYALRSK